MPEDQIPFFQEYGVEYATMQVYLTRPLEIKMGTEIEFICLGGARSLSSMLSQRCEYSTAPGSIDTLVRACVSAHPGALVEPRRAPTKCVRLTSRLPQTRRG